MAQVFNELGQRVLPKVFGKLAGAGLTDLMDVKGETLTQGSGGGRIKTAAGTIYSEIPVVFKPSGGGQVDSGSQQVSEVGYTLTFPSHSETGTRYVIDPKSHRLVVRARGGGGDEPAKTFRIVAVKDLQGNLYEVSAVRENIE